jgi:hypothetical protein
MDPSPSDKTQDILDKPMTPEEEKANLRRSLKAKLNASRIERMTKGAKQEEMNKLQKQVQKELGSDIDLGKVMQYMDQQNKVKK